MVAVSLGPSTVLEREPRSIRLEVCTETGSPTTAGGEVQNRVDFWVDSSVNCILKQFGGSQRGGWQLLKRVGKCTAGSM